LFLLVFISPAYSQEVPLNLQVKLALKVVTYDRNFDRLGDPIKIGASSDEFLVELNALKQRFEIRGRSIVPEKMTAPEDVAKYKIVFVGKNWAKSYMAASKAAAENQCLMFCETEKGVKSGGGAVSFKVVDGKARIVVNPGNMKAQGSDFPDSFIKSTIVIGSS